MEKTGAQLIAEITEAVKKCGEIMKNADRSEANIEQKAGHANFVTAYDKLIQKTIQGLLYEILPEAVFVGEEEDVHAQIEKGYSFIVDPIDGTTNFIKDLKQSAISVALLKDGEQYIGVCYNPYLDEVFTAEKGCGAFLNGQPIHVSNSPLEQAIVGFGTSPYNPERWDKTFEMVKDYMAKALDVRRMGSAVIDLCNVACGRYEIFFEMQLSPWDYAAASLVVKEAGGIVTMLDGETPLTFDHPCSVFARNMD